MKARRLLCALCSSTTTRNCLLVSTWEGFTNSVLLLPFVRLATKQFHSCIVWLCSSILGSTSFHSFDNFSYAFVLWYVMCVWVNVSLPICRMQRCEDKMLIEKCKYVQIIHIEYIWRGFCTFTMSSKPTKNLFLNDRIIQESRFRLCGIADTWGYYSDIYAFD